MSLDGFNVADLCQYLEMSEEESLRCHLETIGLPISLCSLPTAKEESILCFDSDAKDEHLNSPSDHSFGGHVAEHKHDDNKGADQRPPLQSHPPDDGHTNKTRSAPSQTLATHPSMHDAISQNAAPKLEVMGDTGTLGSPSTFAISSNTDAAVTPLHASPSEPHGQNLSPQCGKSDTPPLNDASTTPSHDPSPAPRLVNRRQSPADGTASPRPKRKHGSRLPPPSAERKYPCRWAQVFGGGCEWTFKEKQQHDRHVLSHIPNPDGTLFAGYKCKICVDRWMSALRDAHGKKLRIMKKDLGLFTRRDPCIRHIRARHTGGKDFKNDETSYLIKEEGPWWWPSSLFLDKQNNRKPETLGPRPDGETRSWEEYFRDIIGNHPKVVEAPFSLLKEMNKDRGDGAGPSKRRKVIKA